MDHNKPVTFDSRQRTVCMPPALLHLAIFLSIAACSSSDKPAFPDADDFDVEEGQVAIPTNADDLFSYLQAGTYMELEAESAVHVSAGPHGSGVRTFVNATLMTSLSEGNTSHPVGSGAVKELYDADAVSGWAVSVKTAADGGGAAWYWYEVFSTTNGSNPIEGNGNTICTNCHVGGEDYVLVPFPLQ